VSETAIANLEYYTFVYYRLHEIPSECPGDEASWFGLCGISRVVKDLWRHILYTIVHYGSLDGKGSGQTESRASGVAILACPRVSIQSQCFH
jgi:hypothetical protein